MEIVTAQPVAPIGTEGEESALLSSVRSGDRRAAERLVEASYSSVFASLCKMCGGDRELAADLTQDTYRKAWEALREFDGRARFTTWLYRIAYTTFLNHVRRPARVVPMPENAPEPADPAPRADEIVRSREEYLRLRHAVMSLPEDLRFTVTAHFWGELPVREIAGLEHVTTVAIRKRLERAYRQLEKELAKDKR
jgi:RNA polymerase sigma-70 factor (ECF subfamily)